ncbi:MBL fold metallo-hydrolase [bacterium]|nr:MBL fold metallo-hydrolase [bacterium]MCB9479181.1 MBL fold metallo-hydrolase [Deltaproteobacteria bacterium]
MRIETFTTGLFKTNAYVVGPEPGQDVLVIDPGWRTRELLAYIRDNGLNVVAIVNTHGHADHTCGNKAVKDATGAPICIHEAEAKRLSRFAVGALLTRGRAHWSPPADRLLKDGDTILVGADSFEVIHTPGHTPGGICLKHKKRLFTGDTLMAGTIGRSDGKGGSWDALSASIMDRLFVLSDDIQVYPGHGPRTTIQRERRSNIFVRHSPEQIEDMLLSAHERRMRYEDEKRRQEKEKAKAAKAAGNAPAPPQS